MQFIKKRFYLLTGVISFIVYLFTLAPTIIQIDSGELAAVQSTLGIAHPTGYPLFTIVGFVFSLLPFSKIYLLNLLAAIFCSAGVSVFTYTVNIVLHNLQAFNSKRTAKVKHTSKKDVKKVVKADNNLTEPAANETAVIIASITAGLILAFSKTFWFQSTAVEVYSLQVFLISIILLLLVKAFIFTQKTEGSLTKPWLFFSLSLALGFSNHMTTLLLLPATAYLYFLKNRFSKFSFLLLAKMIGSFLVLLALMYSYLPIRAAMSPIFNWGNPVDFEHFYRHITGQQYQVWLFSSSLKAKKHLADFINGLPKEFYASLFFGIAGIIFSAIKRIHLFAFAVICFLFTILYSINYDINDLDSYFLTAYFAVALFSGYGIYEFYLLFNSGKKAPVQAKHLFITLSIVFVSLQVVLNFRTVNQSDNYLFEDYTKAVLDGVNKDAVILSVQWDFFVSGSYYIQHVENFRSDVTVIDKELLRRSWYYPQITNGRPWLKESLGEEEARFAEALKPFEREEQYDGKLLEGLYRKIIFNIIANNINKRDVYLGTDLIANIRSGEVPIPEGYTVIPDNLLFKVVKNDSTAYYPAKDFNFKLRVPTADNAYTKFILSNSADALTQRAIYEYQHNKLEKAKFYINKVLEFNPNYEFPKGLMQAINK